MKCEGKTAKGKRCRANAKTGERFCSAHLGTAHRPTKLDDTMRERILTALRAGNYVSTAVEMAGIHRSTFANWRERAELGQEPFAAFFDAVEKAEAEGEVALVARIAAAGAGGAWQANAWLLERKHPERWGRRERVDLTGQIEHVSASEFDREVAELEEQMRAKR